MYNPTCIEEQINVFATLIKTRVHLNKSLNLISCLPSYEITHLLRNYDNNIDLNKKLNEINEKLLEILSLYIAIHNSKNEKYISKDKTSIGDNFFINYDRWPLVKRRFFQKFDEWNEKTEMKVNLEFKCLNQSPSVQVAYAMQQMAKSIKRCHPLKLPENYIGKEDFEKLGLSETLLSEIYTDQDFYIHILKHLVNIKGDSSNEKNLKDEQRELYGRKKNKNLERVSKERQIRYNVHEKLEHFMEPIPNRRNNMDPQVVDLLVSSLFK